MVGKSEKSGLIDNLCKNIEQKIKNYTEDIKYHQL